MHEPLLERIRNLERSVQRWRLTSLALLLALLSFMAIRATIGVMLIFVEEDRRQMEMMRMEDDMRAREQMDMARQQEVVAQQQAEMARQEAEKLKNKANPPGPEDIR